MTSEIKADTVAVRKSWELLPEFGLALPGFTLERFAATHPKLSGMLLGQPFAAGAPFADQLQRRIDKALRAEEQMPELLSILTALHDLLNGKLRRYFLSCLIGSARRATRHRRRAGTSRTLWGTTPIISLFPMSEADRLIGHDAETVVYTSYYITSAFDINLRSQHVWVETGDRPELILAFYWLVFIWALQRFDTFCFFNDRGILLPTGGYGSNLGINLDELRILRMAGKTLFTYNYGADHRTRNKTLALGRYNFCTDCPEIGRFCVCDDEGGERMLATIRRYANAMVACGIATKLIPGSINVPNLIVDTSKSQPTRALSGHEGRPLRLVHAPNHPHFKGTRYLEAAVERLRSEGVAIELVMLSGVSNEEVLRLIRDADLVVDQLISGAFGYFAVEAMAMGKPVMCYLTDVSMWPESESLPLINASPETVYETLRGLAADPSPLDEVGRRSRSYVERYLSIPAFSERLRKLFVERGSMGFGERWRLMGGRAGSRLFSALKGQYRQVSRWLGRALEEDASPQAQVRWLIYLVRSLIYLVITRIGKRMKHVVRLLVRSLGLPFLVQAARKGGKRTIINAAIVLGRVMTAWRTHFGTPRTLWGVTPILTLPRLVDCDRLLGLHSESLVYTTYYITSGFDINLKPKIDWILAHDARWYGPFRWAVFLYALIRYDFVHVFCDQGLLHSSKRLGINPRELEILGRAGKRVFTYTYGADVRTRNATLNLGRFNFCMDCPEPGKFCICDDEEGRENIRNIAEYATRSIAMGDMKTYVPDAVDLHFWPVDTDRIGYVGVQAKRTGPLRVAHAPNHPHFKGSEYILDAIGRLQKQGAAIELVKIQGVSNEKVLELFRGVDLVVEQLIGGFHGYTALEAMALGKPVISYLRGADMAIDAERCPIINANPDTIYDVLKDCVQGAYDLPEIGRRSRDYAVRFYSPPAVAQRLGHLYLGSAELPGRWRRKLESRVAELASGMDALDSQS